MSAGWTFAFAALNGVLALGGFALGWILGRKTVKDSRE